MARRSFDGILALSLAVVPLDMENISYLFCSGNFTSTRRKRDLVYPSQGLVLRTSRAKPRLHTARHYLTRGFSFLGDQGTCLPQRARHGTPNPYPPLTILLFCLEKHVSWRYRYGPGVWVCGCVSITNTGSGLQLLPHAELHLSLKC